MDNKKAGREMTIEEMSQFKTLLHQFGFHSSLDEMLGIIRGIRILDALEMNKGNRSRTAKLLRIHRNTLQRYILVMTRMGFEVPPRHQAPKRPSGTVRSYQQAAII